MKNAGVSFLFVCASALLLTACASQPPAAPVAPGAAAVASVAPATASSQAPASVPATTASTAKPATGTPGVSVVGTRYSGTRRVVKDGVEYFCERPTATGSHFIAPQEQCYTEAQLNAIRERDRDFLLRQQTQVVPTPLRGVQRTPVSP